METKTFSYSSPTLPEDYACGTCGVTGCKLWREYQSFGPIVLECCDCAGKSQEKDVSQIDGQGNLPSKHGGTTDSIGWRVPAIPDEQGVGYWGYTSVPKAGVDWWKALPTRVT